MSLNNTFISIFIHIFANIFIAIFVNIVIDIVNSYHLKDNNCPFCYDLGLI